jgi:hypothetical protein
MKERSMNIQNQLICAWCGVICIVLFFIGAWPLAHILPPHLPSASAAEIANIYQQDVNYFRFGMLVLMVGAALLLPFSAAISMQMIRIEGKLPVLAFTQFGAGALGVLVLTIPALLFTATAFRPERAPELILLLNDLAWLMFAMPFGPAAIQSFVIGLAIISDKNIKPLFPRWVGFFNFWAALLFVPAGMISFFKTGPFAWNGLIAFWLPAIVFGVWFMVMFPMLIKAIRQPDPTVNEQRWRGK